MSDTHVLEPAGSVDDQFEAIQKLYEESLKTLDEGQVLTGTIVAKSNDELLVDIGGKSEGVVTARELSPGIEISQLRVGDTLEVLVYRIDSDGDGTMYLSEKRARALKTWEKVLEAHDRNEAINATVTQVVKGGVLVDLGMRGFVPASQIRRQPIGNLEEMVGKQLRLKVIDLDHKRRRVVLSQRVVLDEELNQKKQELLSTLQPGQIREGTVVRLADFGAFVDLGGVDGLIHNTELSWGRIKHPSEVVKVGDQVQVEIMKFDPEARKVSLSLKHSLDDPWKTVPDTLHEGDIVTATVSKATANYLLVELLPGVTGMVPKSEFDASAAPEAGAAVPVKILSINAASRRITASVHAVNPAAQIEAPAETTQAAPVES
jgi:small subunit ribosomal protein S1